MLAHIKSCLLAARHREPDQVRHRPTAGQHPAAPARASHQLRQPRQHLLLDQRWCLVKSGHVRIQP